MRYENAKSLHLGDEVTVKASGYTVMVVSTEVQLGRKNVEILCDDGNWYNHKEVK